MQALPFGKNIGIVGSVLPGENQCGGTDETANVSAKTLYFL